MDKLPPLERGLTILELAASSLDGFTWKQAHAKLGNVSTATVTKLLKVLVSKNFLLHEDGKYKTGPAIHRIIPSKTVKSLLLNQGPLLAKQFSESIQESCVTAVFDGANFVFTGVQIIEGSMGYSPPGTTIKPDMGHVLSQILHSQENPLRLKKHFELGAISFGKKGVPPSWKEYSAALAEGVRNGFFLEYGWRRLHAYRMAIPVFNEENKLAGAFMCGYPSPEALHCKIQANLAVYLKTMNKIPDYEKIYEDGIGKLNKRK